MFRWIKLGRVFDPTTIETMIGRFKRVLEAMTGSSVQS